MAKVKRTNNNFGQKIKAFFNDKFENYKELPGKTRSIINLWAIIVLILILVIIVCYANNKHLKRYTNVEKKMQEAAVKYAEDNELSGINSQKVKLDMAVLIKEKYLKVDNDIEKKCIGYVLVYTDDKNEEKANAYISCKGYATDGFSFE